MRSESWQGKIVPRPGRSRLTEGLRYYQALIYRQMALGLFLSGGAAYVMQKEGLYAALASSPLLWVVILAPLVLVFIMSMLVDRLSPAQAYACFLTYAVLLGVSLGGLVNIYTSHAMAIAFFATSGAFILASYFGLMARRDISRLGRFFQLGLVGIVIAGLVNLLLSLSALDLAISFVGVIVFTGLAAYDTQELRSRYFFTVASGGDTEKEAIVGALALYLDFVNLFLSILRLLGGRRRPA